MKSKLFGGFGVVLLLAVISGLMSISSLSNVDSKASAMYASNTSALDNLGDANTAITDESRLMLHGMVESQEPATQQEVDKGIAEDHATFEKALSDFVALGLSPVEKAGVQTIRNAVNAFVPLRNEVRAMTKSGKVDEADVVADKANAQYETINNALDKLSAFNSVEAKDAADAISSTYSSSRTQTVLLLVASLAIGVGIAFVVSRSIKRAVDVALDRLTSLCDRCMTYLREGMASLAEGDLTHSYAPVTEPIDNPSKDELGQVATAINGIRERIVAAIEAYNTTAERLRDTMGTVAQMAGSVGSSSQQMAATSEESGKATGEIAQAVGDVAEGTGRQVQMLESAKNSAEDVARAVTESAVNAKQAAEVAQATRTIAREGVGAADQANEAMHSVRDSSHQVTSAITELAAKSDQIGAIVETITGIAEQTNLLALNAAIEAARAGDQGRGFAVVAEEVRKLAEESQRAAAEISDLVGAIQGETTRAVNVVEDSARRTEDGAGVVERTREAFRQIESSVDDMTERIAQIATASQQIAASASSMQENIGEVAAVAQQSSASTEEVSASTEETSASAQQIAASAQELSCNAEEMNNLVAQFKLTA